MADYQEPYQTFNMAGINYDIPAYDLPLNLWSNGKNVRFADGASIKFHGESEIFGTPLTAPNWMAPVGYASDYYWIYASTTKVCVTDMAVHTDITPTVFTPGDVDINWNGGIVNNIAVLNNGKQAPIWWTGSPSDKMTALPGWPAAQLAKVVRTYKSYILAMNISDGTGDYPDLVQWSDAAPPGSVPSSWDVADPTLDAGETELTDTQGAIVDAVQLGDVMIIYKQNACYSMQFVGGQYIFQFRKIFTTIGAITSDCVVPVNRQHLVLTNDDLVLHDGVSYKSILDSRMRLWLFSAMNKDKYQRSFMVPHYAKNEVWTCIVTGESEYANIALIWNFVDNTFGFRDLPSPRFIAAGIVTATESSTWDSATQTWDEIQKLWAEKNYSATSPSLLIGDRENTKFLYADSGDSFNGAAFESYLTRESMPLIDRHNVKLVKAVYPRMSSSGSAIVYFRLGSQMNATDPIAWTSLQPFTIGTSDRLDFLVKGRYISIQVFSNTAINWKLFSFDIEYEISERM